MNNPLITIIVPIYKVERYLSTCIESILKQTYTNIEIILVDDGSPDKCGQICDEHATKDNRIQVIHKSNGGLSDARNAALDIAKGEYITFVDSDDYIAQDYVEYLWHILNKNNADISAMLDQHFIDGETPSTATKEDKVNIISPKDYLCKLFYQIDVTTGAQAKLYKKDLFNNIRFPKGLLYEDLLTVYKLVNNCSRIAISNHISYFYRERTGSIIGSPFNQLKYISTLAVIKQLSEDQRLYPKDIQKAIDNRIVGHLFHILLQIPANNLKEKQVIIQNINQRRSSVIFNPKARRKNRIACIISLISYSLLYKLKNIGQERNLE